MQNPGMIKKVWMVLLLGFGLCNPIFSQSTSFFEPDAQASHWVDSVMQALSPKEKLGQLFMVAAYSNKGPEHVQEIDNLIKNYHIGGLIFFQGGPVRQVNLLNHYQSLAKTPLWIGQDAEWGPGMRLDSTMSFPKQMTLGAIADTSLIQQMGAVIAHQLKLLGVQIDFAPVVDINSNPQNPIIGYRSFGENKREVAAKGIAYMKGLQDHGVIATAKHFPGHGDTNADSHLTMPLVPYPFIRLDTLELYPFKRAFAAGMMSTMVAHLHVPALDDTPNLPTTLSHKVVTGLLKDKLGFNGLIFTDALNMKGVSKFYPPGETDLRALKAGNDVLLFPLDVPKAIQKIESAIANDSLSWDRVDSSVRKILRAKYWAGLNHFAPLPTDTLAAQLNSPKAQALNQRLYEAAMTVVKNDARQIPLQVLDTNNFASLSLREEKGNTFQQYLGKYASFTHYNIPEKGADADVYSDLLDELSHYKTVVVGIHHMSNYASRNFGVYQEDLLFLQSLAKRTHVILVVFGNAYSLKYFKNFDEVLCAYEDNEYTRKVAPQVLFGALPATGHLPVSISPSLPAGYGIKTKAIGRLRYGLPESVGMNSQKLQKIDWIARAAIDMRATPGCQILIARHGKVIYSKNFGYMSYDSLRPVTDHTLYDIASVTKVAATLQSIMFLEEGNWIGLDKKVSNYLKETQHTNKKNIKLQLLLLHQAGLIPYIPYWKKTVDPFGLEPRFYSIYQGPNYPYTIAAGLYGSAHLPDSMWQWTLQSPLRDDIYKKKGRYDYKYSDLSFYMLQKVAERVLHQPLDEFMSTNFYEPLGCSYLGYKPLCRLPEEQIAPTEDDEYFRDQLVDGSVHDQGAAMYGGVAGHAGLFSNANDLAILLQMNLWDGYYGGQRYFASGTVPRFAHKQVEDNRRGLGWDKPVMEEGPSPASHLASGLTFGHTGFTGTAIWADPEYDVIYIFLSNRVNPSAENHKLITYNIRTRIQDIIYQAMDDYKPNIN